MRALLLVVTIAACKSDKPTIAERAPSSAKPIAKRGCPGPTSVYAAAYWDGHAAPAKGWRLILGKGSLSDEADGGHAGPIDHAAATAAGARKAPVAVWLFPPGQPACRATVGPLLDQLLFGDSFHNEISAELDGCREALGTGDLVLALEVDDVGRCRFAPTQTVSSRLLPEAWNGEWAPRAPSAPIPPAIASLVPGGCAPPACERLWRVDAATVGALTFAYGIVTADLERDPTRAARCPYVDPETAVRVFVLDDKGAARAPWPGANDDGSELAGVFFDDDGARLLITVTPGEFRVTSLAPPPPGVPPPTAPPPDQFWRQVSPDESAGPILTRGCP